MVLRGRAAVGPSAHAWVMRPSYGVQRGEQMDKPKPKPQPPGRPAPQASKSVSEDDILGMLAVPQEDDDIAPLSGVRAPVKGPAPKAAGRISDDDILDSLDDDEDDETPGLQPKVFQPPASRASLPMDPAARREFERNQARIAALAAQAAGLQAAGIAPDKPKTLADQPARVGLLLIFTGAKAAESAWSRLGEDLTRAATKSVKEVSGVFQMTAGFLTSPRKVLEAVRTLKAAGGILRSYKAERHDVQQWLAEHLK